MLGLLRSLIFGTTSAIPDGTRCTLVVGGSLNGSSILSSMCIRVGVRMRIRLDVGRSGVFACSCYEGFGRTVESASH